MEPVSLEDRAVIAKQLGRRGRALLGVARRCAHGYPQVLVVHPVVEGKPFPTIYWLSCPFLSRQIAHLEASGMIVRIEKQLQSDASLAAMVVSAHLSYIRDRRSLLTEADRQSLERKKMMHSLTQRGIGGIAEFSRVKCLHLHVAHALTALEPAARARTNPIGDLALLELPVYECPAQEVICSAR